MAAWIRVLLLPLVLSVVTQCVATSLVHFAPVGHPPTRASRSYPRWNQPIALVSEALHSLQAPPSLGVQPSQLGAVPFERVGAVSEDPLKWMPMHSRLPTKASGFADASNPDHPLPPGYSKLYHSLKNVHAVLSHASYLSHSLNERVRHLRKQFRQLSLQTNSQLSTLEFDYGVEHHRLNEDLRQLNKQLKGYQEQRERAQDDIATSSHKLELLRTEKDLQMHSKLGEHSDTIRMIQEEEHELEKFVRVATELSEKSAMAIHDLQVQIEKATDNLLHGVVSQQNEERDHVNSFYTKYALDLKRQINALDGQLKRALNVREESWDYVQKFIAWADWTPPPRVKGIAPPTPPNVPGPPPVHKWAKTLVFAQQPVGSSLAPIENVLVGLDSQPTSSVASENVVDAGASEAQSVSEANAAPDEVPA